MKAKVALAISFAALAVLAAITVALAIFVFSATRPAGGRDAKNDEAQKNLDTTPCDKLADNLSKRMGEKDVNMVMATWKGLPENVKREVFAKFITIKLDEFLADYRKADEKTKRRIIESETENFRKLRASLNKTDDKIYKEFIEGMDVKQLTEKLWGVYESKCTPQERAEFDPMAHEFLKQFNDIIK